LKKLPEFGVGIGIGIEEKEMTFDRERCDRYRVEYRRGKWNDRCTITIPMAIPILMKSRINI